MFVDFINKHKILTTVIATVLAVGIIVLSVGNIITSNTQSSKSSESDVTNSSPQTSDPTSTLPYQNSLYQISVIKNNTITIQAPNQFRNAAIQFLYSVGINPTDYKIVFNYESPFTPYE